MSWKKIEERLFDKYCIEGTDNELQTLMKEHDKEVREQVLSEFMNKISDREYLVSDTIKETDYGMFTAELKEIADELKNQEFNKDKEVFDIRGYEYMKRTQDSTGVTRVVFGHSKRSFVCDNEHNGYDEI